MERRETLVRNTLHTAANSVTSSKRSSPRTTSEKRGVPSRTEGERILEIRTVSNATLADATLVL